jgi:hypothetical protein
MDAPDSSQSKRPKSNYAFLLWSFDLVYKFQMVWWFIQGIKFYPRLYALHLIDWERFGGLSKALSFTHV